MKTNLFFILILFVLSPKNSFAQANMKFNQTFSPIHVTQVEVELKNKNFVLKTIKGSRIVIEILVEISSPNTNLLEFIGKSGRYDLEKTFHTKTKTLTLTTKSQKDIITIKGNDISEQVSYVIYLPETIQVVTDTVAANF
ncbi:MAG: Unknown protein [uncultured Aureispira sp.]|uniref:Auto-transporter adhesin head GIN domain-containing protein n=1 Tax=uncultured Aureispira sp. TaxID=1331704 RepID=A0A6S6UAE2_9BACT|nr:MAG: Unknown protein [uncultured Aureispira sp.]